MMVHKKEKCPFCGRNENLCIGGYKVVKEMLCSLLRLTIHRAHNNSLLWLAIEYDRPKGSGENEWYNCEILFTVHMDGHRGMKNRISECSDQFIGYSTGRVFHVDTLAPGCGQTAARGSHSMPVDHRYGRCDPIPLEVVGDHITYRVHDTMGDEGNDLLNILV